MNEPKKRVFVSSVQKEMEVERVAIAGAVSGDRVLGLLYNIGNRQVIGKNFSLIGKARHKKKRPF